MDKTEQLPWKAHRNQLVSVYFNQDALAPANSPLHEEFKLFLARFEAKM